MLKIDDSKSISEVSLSYIQSELEKVKELAATANKAKDIDEFCNIVSQMENILTELSKYEHMVDFSYPPSQKLKDIQNDRDRQIELLKKCKSEKNAIQRNVNHKESTVDNYISKSSCYNCSNKLALNEVEKGNQPLPINDDCQNNNYESTDDINCKIKNQEIYEFDIYLADAGRFCIEHNKGSIGLIMHKFNIKFNRACRIMEELENMGVVGEEIGARPRKILVNKHEYEKIVENYHTKCDNVSTIISDRTNIYDCMNGNQFECFCADILAKSGFINIQITQKSGDHGVDILAEKDDVTYAIQCKCYSDNVGNAAVQQAHTGKSLYHKDIAVVMTNRYFTPQAIEEAEVLSVKLWDRDKICEMFDKLKCNI